ncbi:hypothetical protein RAJCM14343_0241 [Rhodococcus aetherivorans]|uniref:Uncharacterized protein n=1 Tax=Rhodococcus aetherivorans TaxID=191292 RepID=A0ABQ0YEP0_9NOCA|nr:hypothetical protein RAJCM14343_0241 [Rhodococcus aetherivorans]
MDAACGARPDESAACTGDRCRPRVGASGQLLPKIGGVLGTVTTGEASWTM